jgi:Holliday junction resolvase RusA-like endonuclease
MSSVSSNQMNSRSQVPPAFLLGTSRVLFPARPKREPNAMTFKRKTKTVTSSGSHHMGAAPERIASKPDTRRVISVPITCWLECGFIPQLRFAAKRLAQKHRWPTERADIDVGFQQ